MTPPAPQEPKRRGPGGVFWIAAGLFLIPVVACAVLGAAAAIRQPQILAGLPFAAVRVSGTVYGEDATQLETGRMVVTPVAGATVSCGGASATTDAQGGYSLNQLRGGNYTCSVSAARYATATASIHPHFDSAYTLDFGSAAATSNGGACTAVQGGQRCGALALQPGSISGVVVDSRTRQPVNSAQIICWDNSLAARVSASDPARYNAIADAQGQYVVPSVPAGPYLCVSGDNSTPQPVVARPGATDTLDLSNCQVNCRGVSFHSGDVLHALTMYLIFWTPPGARLDPNISDTRARALYTQFVQDLGGSRFYGLLSQYWDYNGPVRNVVRLGATYVDTHTYPHHGTRADPLLDGDITNEITKDGLALHWPLGKGDAAVAIITAYGVQECASGGRDRACSFSTAFNNGFCAYHSANDFRDQQNGDVNLPYMFVPGVPGCDSLLTGGPSPYGAPVTDAEINSLSHELFESVTDPHDDGWFGANGENPGESEIGDLCYTTFGFPASDGSTVRLAHGHGYALQEEWSQASGSCSYG
jgi:hypothetical protein